VRCSGENYKYECGPNGALRKVPVQLTTFINRPPSDFGGGGGGVAAFGGGGGGGGGAFQQFRS
jgi:hypothetical protein